MEDRTTAWWIEVPEGCPEPTLDPGEFIRAHRWLSLRELREALLDGTITDGFSQSAIALAWAQGLLDE